MQMSTQQQQQQQQQQHPPPHRPRKRRPSTRTLLPFLRACVGCPVVVELTNDDVMRGTLESVDDGMNLVLVGGGGNSDGVRWTRRGTSEPRAVLGRDAATEPTTSTSDATPFFAPSLHVRGRRVRFVHLPPSVDPGTVVDAARERAAAARAAYRREILTKAHGGGGPSSSRRKGRDAEGESNFGSSSSSEEGGDDEDGNNQYYYEDYDEDDDEGGEEDV